MDPPPLTNPFANPTSSFDTALSSHTPPPPTQHISNLLPIKLTCDNYLLWKELFIPILQTYDMLDILDGSAPCPPQFITDPQDASLSILNPSFTHWIKKDRTCKIWINSSLSEQILPYTIGSPTSQSLWLNLERRFAATTRSHRLQLKAKLHTTKKGHLSMLEYLQHLKHTADSLVSLVPPWTPWILLPTFSKVCALNMMRSPLQSVSELTLLNLKNSMAFSSVRKWLLSNAILSSILLSPKLSVLNPPTSPPDLFPTIPPPPPLGPSIPPTAPLLHLPINNNKPAPLPNPTAFPQLQLFPTIILNLSLSSSFSSVQLHKPSYPLPNMQQTRAHCPYLSPPQQ